jgi:hypothetical protein
LEGLDSENLNGYDFLRVIVRQINTDMRSQSIKRPMTAAFRGVERERAYGSYAVFINFHLNTFIEDKA